jgi:hypothetical protein
VPNDHFEFLSEYGVAGIMLPAAAVVFLSLKNAIVAQRRRRSQFARGSGFPALMAITGALIYAAVEFNLQIPAYAARFMMIVAMGWLARYLK